MDEKIYQIAEQIVETIKELKVLIIDLFRLGYHVLSLIGLVIVLVILVKYSFGMIIK